MSSGLEVRKADNSVVYSSSSVTWNQVDFFQVNGGQSAAQAYPVLSGREVLIVQTFIDPPPLDRRAIAHTITVSGTSVIVGGGTETSLILVLMR